MFYYLISSGAREGEGDNVVFVREPGNMLDPSCVKVGLLRDRCVYILKKVIFLAARVAFMVVLKVKDIASRETEGCVHTNDLENTLGYAFLQAYYM